jgi:hypothetical protein
MVYREQALHGATCTFLPLNACPPDGNVVSLKPAQAGMEPVSPKFFTALAGSFQTH